VLGGDLHPAIGASFFMPTITGIGQHRPDDRAAAGRKLARLQSSDRALKQAVFLASALKRHRGQDTDTRRLDITRAKASLLKR
jgi:hypothetical protein